MVDPSQRTLTRIEYVGLSMVTCRFIRRWIDSTLLVVEEFASLEMRSLSIRFYPVNVVAVRIWPSLTSEFNTPGLKCVDQHTNAILCPPKTRG
jgi:hypothetical protein